MNMQMIDVLKRLAELDNKSTNDVKKDKVEECGPMGDVETPKSPATINITAADGAELGNMLNAIMQLAGVHKVGDEHMGVEPPASVLTAEPTMSTGPHAADNMRSVLDRMNDIGDEEADESMGHEHGIPGIDNTPADPHTQLPFEPNEFAQNTNDSDGNDENGHPRLTTQPTATFENLMAEYQDFLKEGSYGGEEHDMMEGEGDEGYVACIVQYNRSGQAMVQRTKPISRDRAEEVIKHALSKNTFVHPPFMTIYPASAGKLDGSTIMAQFPDMSKEGLAEGKVCSSCNMPMKKCSCD